MITLHPTYLLAVQAIVGDCKHRFELAQATSVTRVMELSELAACKMKAAGIAFPESTATAIVKTMRKVVARDLTVCVDYIEGPSPGMIVSEYTKAGVPLHFIAFKR